MNLGPNNWVFVDNGSDSVPFKALGTVEHLSVFINCKKLMISDLGTILVKETHKGVIK